MKLNALGSKKLLEKEYAINIKNTIDINIKSPFKNFIFQTFFFFYDIIILTKRVDYEQKFNKFNNRRENISDNQM